MAMFTDKQLMAVGAVVAVGGYLVWKKGIPALGNAINPTNPENIFYAGTNAFGEAVTGQPGWSLGGAFYKWMDPHNLGTNTDTITGN